jgi:single-strand DNA-binding protein
MNTINNKVQLIGFLGMNPDIRTLEGGKKMARISIATSDSYNNAKGEKITETYWHNIIAWGKTAEIAEQSLAKGSHVSVEGKLVNRSYVDKQGVKKYVTEVVANELTIMVKKEA